MKKYFLPTQAFTFLIILIFGATCNGPGSGVYRYDARLNDEVGQGKTITDFKSKVVQK